MERSVLKLPLSKLCAVSLALENRAFVEGEKGEKGAEKRGGRGVTSKGGKKEKRTHENRSENGSVLSFHILLTGLGSCLAAMTRRITKPKYRIFCARLSLVQGMCDKTCMMRRRPSSFENNFVNPHDPPDPLTPNYFEKNFLRIIFRNF